MPSRPLARFGDALLPVPWSQEGDRWGKADKGKLAEAQERSLCLVCGTTVRGGVVFWRVMEGVEDDLRSPCTPDDLVHEGIVIDGAPMHRRCAKLAGAHCPVARARLGEGAWIERAYVASKK